MTAKTILDEETKNASVNRNNEDDTKFGPSNIVNDIINFENDVNVKVKVKNSRESLRNSLRSSVSEKEKYEVKLKYKPKIMFPEIESKEAKFTKVENIQNDFAEIEHQTEYAPTPLIKKSLNELIYETNDKVDHIFETPEEIDENDSLIKFQNSGRGFKDHEFVLEKSILESKELIDNFDTLPNDQDKNNLKKLKSKKLRRRRKIPKQRYKNTFTTVAKK